MAELDLYWFLALLFTPLAVGLISFLSNLKTPAWTSWYAVLGTSLVLGISLAITSQFKYDTVDQLGILDDDEFRSRSSLYERAKLSDLNPDYEVKNSFDWVARVRWVPKYQIQFYLGMDGLNLGCILIANFAFFLTTLSAWMKEKELPGQFPFFSLAQFGLTGVFLSLDSFFLLFFLTIFLFAGYFLGLGFVPIAKRKLASIGAQLSLISSVLIASVLLFSAQSNMDGFTNPDEKIAATSHLKRLHPDWSEKKVQEFLGSHSWNIMAFQRAGIATLNNQFIPEEVKQSPWFGKKTQVICFLLVVTASLGLIFANFLFLLSLETAGNGSVLAAMPCSMMFGLVGMYLYARVGVSVFPMGATLASPTLFWVFLGLTGIAAVYLVVWSRIWGLPARFYLWSQFALVMGFSAVLSLRPDSWNPKMFSGIFLGELSLCIVVPLIFFLFMKIQAAIKLDLFEIPLGLWKSQPLLVLVVAITFALGLGVPGSLGFLGQYSTFGASLAIGGILPFVALLILFLFVVRGLFKSLELLSTGTPVGEAHVSFSIPEIIGVLISFVILIGLGFFPNWVLSWYYPSSSAIIDLIQIAWVK